MPCGSARGAGRGPAACVDLSRAHVRRWLLLLLKARPGEPPRIDACASSPGPRPIRSRTSSTARSTSPWSATWSRIVASYVEAVRGRDGGDPPPSHPLSAGLTCAEDFASETLLTYSPKEDSTVYQRLLAPCGVTAQVQQVQITEAIIELVKAGMGVAVLAGGRSNRPCGVERSGPRRSPGAATGGRGARRLSRTWHVCPMCASSSPCSPSACPSASAPPSARHVGAEPEPSPQHRECLPWTINTSSPARTVVNRSKIYVDDDMSGTFVQDCEVAVTRGACGSEGGGRRSLEVRKADGSE